MVERLNKKEALIRAKDKINGVEEELEVARISLWLWRFKISNSSCSRFFTKGKTENKKLKKP